MNLNIKYKIIKKKDKINSTNWKHTLNQKINNKKKHK